MIASRPAAKLIAKLRSDFEARVRRAGLVGPLAVDPEVAEATADVVAAMARLEQALGGVR